MKHKKIIVITVAAAACLLLLAFAYPVFNYIAENTDFFAGWGSGTTEESLNELINENTVTEIPDTTNGMYDEYILTEEDLAELNEAYFRRNFLYNPSYANKDEANMNRIKESIYGKFAENIETAMMQSTDSGANFYFGKYSDSIVVAINAMIPRYNCYKICDYEFSFYATTILVCNDSTFYELDDAYEKGLLTESDIQIIYQLCLIHYFKGRTTNETNN